MPGYTEYQVYGTQLYDGALRVYQFMSEAYKTRENADAVASAPQYPSTSAVGVPM